MNFDPDKYFYTIQPASPFPGVNVVLVRLETRKTKVFYMANQSVNSAGLVQAMDSLTDDLILEFFEKPVRPKKSDGRKKKEQKDG